MDIILFSILLIVGIFYSATSILAMFWYVVPEQGEYDSKLETKRFMIAMLLTPVAPIIGPYFIYKALKGER